MNVLSAAPGEFKFESLQQLPGTNGTVRIMHAPKFSSGVEWIFIKSADLLVMS